MEQYDIVADREKMNSELVNSDEVDRIVSTIEVNNLETIVTFGAEVAEEISKASDVVLNSMNMSQLDDYIAKRQQDMAVTGDESIQFELTSLNQALMMMEQRTQDLRTAENVAMQSIPMIKTMEFSNYNLVRKINSAFIVTLPVFKQALAQAILLKRQRIQAEAMSALDKKTNEMLIKNAQNTVEVSKATAKMASGSSIQIETLETTWRTITSGIEETRRIQEDCRKKRVEDQARLEAIKADFNRQYHMPPANK